MPLRNRLILGSALFVAMATIVVAEEVRRDFGSYQRAHPRGGSLLGVAEPYMVSGYHAGENRMCGSKLVFVDGSANGIGGAAKLAQNQRFGMLSTDDGHVMVGFHGGTNELLEQPLPEGPTYRYYFTYGDEPWSQFAGMHVCRSGDGLVGIHFGQNVFTAVTARTPPTMENEPKSPTVVEVYFDLLACDELVHAGNRDEIRIYANGESLIKDTNDAVVFDARGRVMGRSANGFVTKNGKALDKSLKLGTIKLDADDSRYVVLTVIEGPCDTPTERVLDGIKQLCAKPSPEQTDDEFSEAVARLNVDTKSTHLLATCIVGARKTDKELQVNWLSGTSDQQTVVASALGRQARFYCSQGNGSYWAALHVEVK